MIVGLQHGASRGPTGRSEAAPGRRPGPRIASRKIQPQRGALAADVATPGKRTQDAVPRAPHWGLVDEAGSTSQGEALGCSSAHRLGRCELVPVASEAISERGKRAWSPDNPAKDSFS